MSLFRTLFIIAVSYYLIKFILRFFSRMRGTNSESWPNNKTQSTNKFKNESKKGRDHKNDLGKYVDYEEFND